MHCRVDADALLSTATVAVQELRVTETTESVWSYVFHRSAVLAILYLSLGIFLLRLAFFHKFTLPLRSPDDMLCATCVFGVASATSLPWISSCEDADCVQINRFALDAVANVPVGTSAYRKDEFINPLYNIGEAAHQGKLPVLQSASPPHPLPFQFVFL